MVKILKQDAERLLGDVPQENVFWCCDGRVIRGMPELGDWLSDVDDQIFEYHSNAEKRDFSNWVSDIIGDQKLARDLQKAANRNQAHKATVQRIEFLRSKL